MLLNFRSNRIYLISTHFGGQTSRNRTPLIVYSLTFFRVAPWRHLRLLCHWVIGYQCFVSKTMWTFQHGDVLRELYCTVCTALCRTTWCTVYSTVYCTVLYCAVLCCAVLCCVVLCCAVICCTDTVLQCYTAVACTVLCYAVLCCVVLCCIVLYCNLYCIVLLWGCIVLYCSVVTVV